MTKKRLIAIIILSAVFVLILVLTALRLLKPDEYKPAADEIALNIQMDTKEDVGLVVFDYTVDGKEQSGGVSNANKSLIQHDEKLVAAAKWNKSDLITESDTVVFEMRFRIITEYVDPNFANVYREDITRYLDPVSWETQFGSSCTVRISGDRDNGYWAEVMETSAE